MKEPLELKMLESAFRLRCNDRMVHHILELLWKPFAVGPTTSADHISIERDGQIWKTSILGESAEASDLWDVITRVSSAMFQRTVQELTTYIDLHSAVLGKADAVLLLTGRSGMGKTTMAIELIESHGWKYLSDDLAAFRIPEGDIVPFPKPLHLKDVSRWPRFRRHLPANTPSPTRSFWMPPDALSRADQGGRPTHVAFLHGLGGGTETGLEPLTAGQGIHRLGQLVSQMTPESLRVLVDAVGAAAVTEAKGPSAQLAPLISTWADPN